MKLEQQQQAQHLFFQTDLSKTEISEALGIPRRTLSYWAKENNWDRIKKSAQHMPALIAENLYIAMARLSDSFITEDRMMKPVTKDEATTLHKLYLTATKLKNRATLNENLEMLKYFMEHIDSKDPKMADLIKPFVDDYIATRAKVQPGQFLSDKFNDYGFLMHKEENTKEIQLDIAEEMDQQYGPAPVDNGPSLEQKAQPEQPAPTKPTPHQMSGLNTRPTPDPITDLAAVYEHIRMKEEQVRKMQTSNQFHKLNRAQRRKLAQQTPSTTHKEKTIK